MLVQRGRAEMGTAIMTVVLQSVTIEKDRGGAGNTLWRKSLEPVSLPRDPVTNCASPTWGGGVPTHFFEPGKLLHEEVENALTNFSAVKF
jgi:hypothetical protein